jgi:hypothetical protein
MKQHTLTEFKLWTVCMAVGSVALASEMVVKARHVDSRPSESSLTSSMELDRLVLSPSEPETDHVLPVDLVAKLLVEAVIQVESGGQPRMVGGKGERGLMQIMKGTWRETTQLVYGRALPFQRAFDPATNRRVGNAYLSRLHAFLLENRAGWRADERSLLLAAYNAGPQRLADADFNVDRLPASTQDYVKRVSALHDVYLGDHALKLEPGQAPGMMQLVSLDQRGDS